MAWIAPSTFSAAATLTAAQMNAEVRDHALWLKSALNVITNSTISDSGDSTYLDVRRAVTGASAFQCSITGDAATRLRITSDGSVWWGDGTSAVDTVLQRTAASLLQTSDQFRSSRAAAGNYAFSAQVDGDAVSRLAIQANGTMVWSDGSAAADTGLYRGGVDVLQTDDAFRTKSGIVIDPSGTCAPTAKALTIYVATPVESSFDLALVESTITLGSSAFVEGAAKFTAPLYVPSASGGIFMQRGAYMSFGTTYTEDTATLYSPASGVIKSDGALWGLGALITKTKAGIPTDADLLAGAQQVGAIVVDTTNNRIYCRTGAATWKYAALT